MKRAAGIRRKIEGWLMRASYLFTSESVSEGHPDKVSDQISDAVLDAFIEKDVKLGIADDSLVNTRLGCETLCTTNKIVIAGEGRGQLFRDIHGKSVVDRIIPWKTRPARCRMMKLRRWAPATRA